MDPLRLVEATINCEDHSHGSAEKLEVSGELLKSPSLVLTRHANRCVEILAVLLAPSIENIRQLIRKDLELRPLSPRLRAFANPSLQLGEIIPGHHKDIPRLQVATGRRSRRGLQDAPQDIR